MNRAQYLIDRMFLGEAPAPAVAPPKPTTTPVAPPAPSKPRPGTRPWKPSRKPDVSPKPKARGGDEDTDSAIRPHPKATDVGRYSNVPLSSPTAFGNAARQEADQAPVPVPPPPSSAEAGGPEPEPLSSPIALIKPGDRVTIVTPHGSRLSGRATMRSRTGGWVLNLGGAHGTPGLADDENVISVSRAGKRIYGRM